MAKTRYLSLIAACAVSVSFAPAASAGERQRLVEHSDLDLSTSAGQATLKKRVNSAVHGVCAFPSARTAAERIDQQRCETRARTSAMRQAGQTIARYGASVKVAID
jgi:UrcA family protein